MCLGNERLFLSHKVVREFGEVYRLMELTNCWCTGCLIITHSTNLITLRMRAGEGVCGVWNGVCVCRVWVRSSTCMYVCALDWLVCVWLSVCMRVTCIYIWRNWNDGVQTRYFVNIILTYGMTWGLFSGQRSVSGNLKDGISGISGLVNFVFITHKALSDLFVCALCDGNVNIIQLFLTVLLFELVVQQLTEWLSLVQRLSPVMISQCNYNAISAFFFTGCLILCLRYASRWVSGNQYMTFTSFALRSPLKEKDREIRDCILISCFH